MQDLTITRQTFQKFAAVELQYRHLESSDLKQVLDDIYNTSLCVCLRGIQDKEEFMLLQDGVSRIGNFIHSEKYNIESAIVNASKAAYLSKLIEYEIDEVKHYDKSMFESISSETLQLPIHTKLNKLKKTLGEAFFYWLEIQKIVNG